MFPRGSCVKDMVSSLGWNRLQVGPRWGRLGHYGAGPEGDIGIWLLPLSFSLLPGQHEVSRLLLLHASVTILSLTIA
jgi:hypothetical protein